MKTIMGYCLIFLSSFSILVAAADPLYEGIEAQPADVSTVDAIVGSYYETISGLEGPRDTKRFQSLFTSQANVVANGKGSKIEDFVSSARFLNIAKTFYEREFSRDEQQFGNIVNVFSSYRIRSSLSSTEYSRRGITNFQLINDGQRR